MKENFMGRLAFIFMAVMLQSCIFFRSWIDIEWTDQDPLRVVYSNKMTELSEKNGNKEEVIGMISFESRVDLRSNNWNKKDFFIDRDATLCRRSFSDHNMIFNDDRNVYDDNGLVQKNRLTMMRRVTRTRNKPRIWGRSFAIMSLSV